jgi:transketolase
MRRAIAKELLSIMKENEDVYLLFGDLGFGVLDQIRDCFPDRAINCGIAEQNMIGVAAGLATSGKTPVVYSIAPFVSTRVLEQIKLDLCQQNLKVIIVGTGAGFAYGTLGPTHHCLEDFASLTCLPNLSYYQPYDLHSAKTCFRNAINSTRPAFIRLTNDGLDLSKELYKGKMNAHSPSWKKGYGLIVSTGSITANCIKAAKDNNFDLLAIDSFEFMFSDQKKLELLDTLLSYDLVVTVEESYLRGGFGSLIVEILQEPMCGFADMYILRIGVDSKFPSGCGTQEELRKEFGLDGNSISKRIFGLLNDY